MSSDFELENNNRTLNHIEEERNTGHNKKRYRHELVEEFGPIPASEGPSDNFARMRLQAESYPRTAQALKIFVLEYLKVNAIENISLSTLRSVSTIENFVSAIVQRYPVKPLSETSEPLSISAQIFQTLLNVLNILVQDGNLVCKSRSNYLYITVGRWNMEEIINHLCSQAACEISGRLYARDVWKAAQSRGGPWTTVTKNVVADICKEVLAGNVHWEEKGNTGKVWIYQPSPPT